MPSLAFSKMLFVPEGLSPSNSMVTVSSGPRSMVVKHKTFDVSINSLVFSNPSICWEYVAIAFLVSLSMSFMISMQIYKKSRNLSQIPGTFIY